MGSHARAYIRNSEEFGSGCSSMYVDAWRGIAARTMLRNQRFAVEFSADC